jgi:hypothetical protein
MVNETEARIRSETGYVVLCARRVVIHADNFMALLEQALAQVRANKTRASGN